MLYPCKFTYSLGTTFSFPLWNPSLAQLLILLVEPVFTPCNLNRFFVLIQEANYYLHVFSSTDWFGRLVRTRTHTHTTPGFKIQCHSASLFPKVLSISLPDRIPERNNRKERKVENNRWVQEIRSFPSFFNLLCFHEWPQGRGQLVQRRLYN